MVIGRYECRVMMRMMRLMKGLIKDRECMFCSMSNIMEEIKGNLKEKRDWNEEENITEEGWVWGLGGGLGMG